MLNESSPLPSPAHVLNIYSRMQDVGDDVLALYTERERMSMLWELTTKAPQPDQPGLQEWEIARLLRTRLYPRDLYEQDIRVARSFNRLAASLQTKISVWNDHSPVRVFRQACQKAMSASGIRDDDITLNFHPLSFKTRPEPPFSGTEMVARACVSTSVDKESGNYCSNIWLNTDIALWNDPLVEGDQRLGIIPGISIHEVCHIFGKIQHVEGASDSLYTVMWQEKALVKDFDKTYPVYRATLLERQAHLRQQLYLSYLKNTPHYGEEHYLYDDLGLEEPAYTGQALIAAVR